MIRLMRRRYSLINKQELPSTYTSVLAVHLHGLMTGHVTTNKTRLETIIKFKKDGRVCPYAGRSDAGLGMFNYGGRRFDWLGYSGDGNSYTISSIDLNEWYSLEHGYKEGLAILKVGDITKIFNNKEFIGGNLCLFRNLELTSYDGTGEFQRTKIFENDILIRDYIPCIRKIDNIVGMYDVITNKFHAGDSTSYAVYE